LGVPQGQGSEYPPGKPMEPIDVVISGRRISSRSRTYLGQYHLMSSLDSPVFRAQTKSDPYPPAWTTLSSAIFTRLGINDCCDYKTEPGYRHIPHQRLPRCSRSIQPCPKVVPIVCPCTTPSSRAVAASYQGGDEGSLLCIQHQQGH